MHIQATPNFTLTRLWSTLLLLTPVVAQPAPTPGAFFRPAPQLGTDLPADGPYPHGQRLTFSLYSIRSVKDDWARPGFTAIGPYYGAQAGAQFAPYDSVTNAAGALGLKCFYRVGMDIPFLKEHVLPSDDEITATLTAQVRAVADRPEIAVWYLTPEELRYWRQDEIRYLQVATDAIRAADPQQRPVMLYEPNHRDAGALSKTLAYLDFSSKGMYANSTGHQDSRAWIRWGVEQELQAIAAVKPEATSFAVLWMAADPKPEEAALIPRWTRHDVYLSLVSGAKGIVIWSGFRRANFSTFDAYLNGYAAAAQELNGPSGLGRVFLFGERRTDLRVEVVAGPEEQAVRVGETELSYPTVSWLDAALGTDRYLFLVNSASEAVRVKVTGFPAGDWTKQDLFAGEATAAAADDWASIVLQPLEVRGWRLRPGG